jgi:long-subunit acyl-CoA synthetase (AMP-forming)
MSVEPSLYRRRACTVFGSIERKSNGHQQFLSGCCAGSGQDRWHLPRQNSAHRRGHITRHITALLEASKLAPGFGKTSDRSDEDLAFLVYSSGTTGLPKGVMLTHRNIIANITQNSVVNTTFLEWTRDRSLGFLPMYHIYGRFRLCIIDSC